MRTPRAGAHALPDVSQRMMFGMRAFYRNTVIFAMLPDKHAIERPRAIAYKLDGKWELFDLESEHDVTGALACLNGAFEKAGGLLKSSP
ncbi:MAG: hypothetical protein ABSB15_19220 [Bryobacteraceae bacterium]|jgi:hypothetical protein